MAKRPRDPLVSSTPSKPNRKRERSRCDEFVPRLDPDDRKPKRQKQSSVKSAVEDSASPGLLIDDNPVEYWRKEHTWPPEYFEMAQPLTRKRSSSSRSLDLESSRGTSTDLPREAKSAPYKDARYETLLAKKGAFMDEADLSVTDSCKELYKNLLYTDQEIPKDSLFRDDIFQVTCRKIRNENESRVVLDMMRLIVPSAECLATFGDKKLDILIEKVNSSWLKCIPLTNVRPQPDYSVGFRESAFTEDQVNKLSPFVGGYKDQCSVMAREDMYFPFLTCEVKCGDQALSVADRQNMHSASVSVKGIVELFKRVNRESDLHRKILAFSISHNSEIVKIYGHYALIDGTKTHFYRHAIHQFLITAQDGREKWTAYKFTRNIYDSYVPMHLERIRAAVDQLPGPEVFLVESLPQYSTADSVEQAHSELTASYSEESLQRLPSSHTSEPEFKKPKGRNARG